MPAGYEGGYGSNIKAMGLMLKSACNMSESKILDFLHNSKIIISAGTVSNMLIKEEIKQLLSKHFPFLTAITKTRVLEATAIASYHQEEDYPVISILLCDDAPQFKLLTEYLALCWVHDGRHYKKLSPVVPRNVKILEGFITRYWEYYRKLLVLKYPELPLHNNASELAARQHVRKRDVSLRTSVPEGTKATDTFLTIVETCKKLGINCYDYFLDRITRLSAIPPLAEIISLKSAS